MSARVFSLANGIFQVPATGGLQFGWAALDGEVASQIAYQEQFLQFFRFLFQNLQSVPEENQHWNPLALSLSLRAGALKTYVLAAVSIIEGAIAELAALRGIGQRDTLHKKTFGSLIRLLENNQPLYQEFSQIWEHLQLLKKYRNFVHLGNAANAPEAYWQDLINSETALLTACDETIQWLSQRCNGNPTPQSINTDVDV